MAPYVELEQWWLIKRCNVRLLLCNMELPMYAWCYDPFEIRCCEMSWHLQESWIIDHQVLTL